LKSLMQLENVDTTFVELPQARAASPHFNLEADETLPAICNRAEAMVLILPEYNYGSAPVLQSILQTLLRGSSRKALGICDLSPGWSGGLRVMQELLPVMRQARVLPLLWEANLAHDLNWLDNVGQWREEKHRAPLENFLQDVISLAASLRRPTFS
ncbi:MAG: NAD(P)H-dependent oxidoreductase, partial [candidate division KSB1 bacterium]